LRILGPAIEVGSPSLGYEIAELVLYSLVEGGIWKEPELGVFEVAGVEPEVKDSCDGRVHASGGRLAAEQAGD